MSSLVPPVASPLVSGDRPAARFTRVFLLVLVLGMSASAVTAVVVDPTRTFGTGRIPPLVTREYETKPPVFLAIEPPRSAIVLGSSVVMKLSPACITELTGLPAYNFGLNGASVEDMVAAYRFVRARSRTPIRELILGVDVEGFNARMAPAGRQRWAPEVRAYLGDGARTSFEAATGALFGWRALRHAASAVWHHLHGDPEFVSYSEDGFITYGLMEAQIRAGTFKPEPKDVDVTGYTQLSAPRVAALRELVAAAHDDGIQVDAFLPPIGPRNRARLAARTRELDAVLLDLERRGQLRYLRISSIEEVGGDPAGYFDGLHLTEANASHLLLAMFHKSHGCNL